MIDMPVGNEDITDLESQARYLLYYTEYLVTGVYHKTFFCFLLSQNVTIRLIGSNY